MSAEGHPSTTASEPRFLPSQEAFAGAFAKRQPQVVWTRLIADLETPVSSGWPRSRTSMLTTLASPVGWSRP